MKIAFVIERMDPSRGGRETSTAQIASALAGRGHDVTILCRDASWSADGVTVLPLGRRGLARAGRLANFVADVQKQIGEGEYDVVHATLPVPGANVYQLRSGTLPGQADARRKRLGAAGAIHASTFGKLNMFRRRMAELERQVFSDPGTVILPVSDMVAEEVRRYYDRSDNVRVIYNGVDVPDPSGEGRADARQRIRYKMGVKRDDTVFITVAKNFRLKGIAELISAFGKWYHEKVGREGGALIVVGRDMPESYKRFAGARDIGSRVLFVPPNDNIFDWYAAADACFLLSWYDPCSRVILEAVRWGIPAVTTTLNGAAEILAQGAGIVVESPKDTAGVVAAMDELADPRRREVRIEKCRDIAESLGVDRHVNELLEAYEEMLGQGK